MKLSRSSFTAIPLPAVCAVMVLAGLLPGAPVSAAEFQTPDWSGHPAARSAEWLDFTTAYGSPGNAPDVTNTLTEVSLLQTEPGAILTGTRNIYHPGAGSRFEIPATLERESTTVVLQLKTSGTELAYEEVRLEFPAGGGTTLPAINREELNRESGSFGDTVVSRWTWSLSEPEGTSFVLHFEAAGPHCSLVSARLDALLVAPTVTLERSEPVLDRWNYPFNVTPGTRAVASTFQSVEDEVGISRHGHYVFGFDTEPDVPAGLGPASYEILSARVILTTSTGFEVAYDSSWDEVFTCLPEEHAGHVSDPDNGRPLELFGVGIRNGFTIRSWEETTPYSPDAESNRTVHPIALDESGKELDAGMNVRFIDPFEVAPFAIGQVDGLEAGSALPADTAVTFDLNLSHPGIVAYLRRALDGGRLLLTATSLHSGGQGVRTFPEYYTRDSLIGIAPRLEMAVRVNEPAPAPRVLISMQGGQPAIILPGGEPQNHGIRHTSDFQSWHTVESPQWQSRDNGQSVWTDDSPGASLRFYQVFETP